MPTRLSMVVTFVIALQVLNHLGNYGHFETLFETPEVNYHSAPLDYITLEKLCETSLNMS